MPLKLGLHFSRLDAPNGISVYARSLLNASSSPSFHLCSRIWPPTRADLLKILPPCSCDARAYPISLSIKTASVSIFASLNYEMLTIVRFYKNIDILFSISIISKFFKITTLNIVCSQISIIYFNI